MEVIVQAAGSTEAAQKLVQSLGGKVGTDLPIIHGFTATIPARILPSLAAAASVRWISEDAAVVHSSACTQCLSTTNLLSLDTQDVGAPRVWNEGPGYLQGTGIGVAVVDSGVNPTQDLYTPSGYSRLVANVAFNSGPNTSVTDMYGHGDHVAGIIAGNGGRSNGAYVGVAPSANIINVKVSDDQGASTASKVVQGLQWVLANKSTYNIRVVNLSLNSTLPDSYNVDPIDAAAEMLWFNGIVVVASAGNSGGVYAPANDPFVITVGAVDDRGSTNVASHSLAKYSVYGNTTDGFSKPDVVAPGSNLVSLSGNVNCVICVAHPGNVVNGPSGSPYLRMSGTSMSAPVVSGVVALLLQSNPGLTPDQVKYRLKATAHFLGTGTGAGEVDAFAAVHGATTATSNTGVAASHLLWTSSQPVIWNSANWGSANWGSANWGSANWGSANWGSVNWGSDYWGS